MKKYIIFTDGASRGNPGLAATGFVISTVDGVIWVQDGSFLGVATNNEAEYQALIDALKRLVADFSANLPADIEVKADSLLVVNQLKGLYKVKHPGLYKLYLQVKQLEPYVGKISYTHIPRAQNSLADKMANLVLDRNLANGS